MQAFAQHGFVGAVYTLFIPECIMSYDIGIEAGLAPAVQAQDGLAQRNNIFIPLVAFRGHGIPGSYPLFVFRERQTMFRIVHFHHLHGSTETTDTILIIIIQLFFRKSGMVEHWGGETLMTYTQQHFLVVIVVVEA